jgi:hypothetical protein
MQRENKGGGQNECESERDGRRRERSAAQHSRVQ